MCAWLEAHGGERRDDLYHFAAISEEHRDKVVLTVVRHPYHRMRSLYNFIRSEFWPVTSEGAAYMETVGMSFVEFVRWCMTKPHQQWQSQTTILEPVLDKAIIYRYEEIDDWGKVARFGYHRRLWVSSRAEHQLNAPAVESLSVSHEVLEKIR
jgi:hypothetical protein